MAYKAKTFVKLGSYSPLALSELLYELNFPSPSKADLMNQEKLQWKACNLLPLSMYLQRNNLLTLSPLVGEKNEHVDLPEKS